MRHSQEAERDAARHEDEGAPSRRAHHPARRPRNRPGGRSSDRLWRERGGHEAALTRKQVRLALKLSLIFPWEYFHDNLFR